MGPPHRDNLIVVTEEWHFGRMQGVPNALPAESAARQATLLTGSAPRDEVSVCPVRVTGQYVERLEVRPGPVFLPETLKDLVYPAMTNHVWWACEHAPGTETLRRVARLSDQTIPDTLTGAPTLVACTLSDTPLRSIPAQSGKRRLRVPDCSRPG